MCRYNGRLKLRRTAEGRLGRQFPRGIRIPAMTAHKQKAPEGALSDAPMAAPGIPAGAMWQSEAPLSL